MSGLLSLWTSESAQHFPYAILQTAHPLPTYATVTVCVCLRDAQSAHGSRFQYAPALPDSRAFINCKMIHNSA